MCARCYGKIGGVQQTKYGRVETMSTIAADMPRPAARRIPWYLFAFVLLVGAAITLVCVALFGVGEDAAAHVTRYTARFSFLLFVVVFSTGALAQLVPSPATRWLRSNRRYMGLSFALAHTIHLGAIVTLFALHDSMPDNVTLIGGGIAYAFIAMMAATSNDAAVRWLGTRFWRGLHLAGASYIWLIFMNSYVGRILVDSPPLLFVALTALGAGALLLRIAAALQRRAGSSTRATA
jgi:methionine sulfoxide reductase heme-binding subunit